MSRTESGNISFLSSDADYLIKVEDCILGVEKAQLKESCGYFRLMWSSHFAEGEVNSQVGGHDFDQREFDLELQELDLKYVRTIFEMAHGEEAGLDDYNLQDIEGLLGTSQFLQCQRPYASEIDQWMKKHLEYYVFADIPTYDPSTDQIVRNDAAGRAEVGRRSVVPQESDTRDVQGSDAGEDDEMEDAFHEAHYNSDADENAELLQEQDLELLWKLVGVCNETGHKNLGMVVANVLCLIYNEAGLRWRINFPRISNELVDNLVRIRHNKLRLLKEAIVKFTASKHLARECSYNFDRICLDCGTWFDIDKRRTLYCYCNGAKPLTPVVCDGDSRVGDFINTLRHKDFWPLNLLNEFNLISVVENLAMLGTVKGLSTTIKPHALTCPCDPVTDLLVDFFERLNKVIEWGEQLDASTTWP